jgi:hypothetical protein
MTKRASEETACKEEIRCAAEQIKKIRKENRTEWNGTKEIRKQRDAPRQ